MSYDSGVEALAEAALTNYRTVTPEMVTAMADVIQAAIDRWLEEVESMGILRETTDEERRP